MEQEFFEVFPTLLGLHGTQELRADAVIGAVTTPQNFKQADYVKKYYSLAQKIGKAFGINPVVILAQAAIESDWGTSNLAKNYNNFFGITAFGSANAYWKGGKYISKSSGFAFRTYANAQDGFSDFARLLVSKYNTAAKASHSVTEYARLISASPYISDQHGDNRGKYKELIIRNAVAITTIVKKLQSLYN